MIYLISKLHYFIIENITELIEQILTERAQLIRL